MICHLVPCFEDEGEELLKEARKLVDITSQSMLAKSDSSLWCRLKLLLILTSGESSEHFLSQVIAECYDVDWSNNVFTVLSAHHHDIERALWAGAGSSGNRHL